MEQSLTCVDANVIVRSLVFSPLTDKAHKLMTDARAMHLVLVAPSLLAFEVTSVLRRLVVLRALTAQEGEEALDLFTRLPIRLSQRKGIIPLSWQFAKRFNQSRTYDSSYLAVAQIHGCDFWTADEKLYNAVGNTLSWVKWLGDYS